jgi:biopolymer transport protein ExbD
MRLPRAAEPEFGDPMTPMIDVVFLLLVFFICASAGAISQKLLPAELKGASSESAAAVSEPESSQAEHLTVRIRLQPGTAGLEVLLDEQPLSDLVMLQKRLTQLAAVDSESRIILSIHDEVPVQQFISVYDLCQSLKFGDISFAVAGNRQR